MVLLLDGTSFKKWQVVIVQEKDSFAGEKSDLLPNRVNKVNIIVDGTDDMLHLWLGPTGDATSPTWHFCQKMLNLKLIIGSNQTNLN